MVAALDFVVTGKRFDPEPFRVLWIEMDRHAAIPPTVAGTRSKDAVAA
jgi:hypothetical protein